MRPLTLPAALPILALLLCILTGCDPDAAEKEAIRASWAALDDCEKAGDGHGYIKLLTTRSIPYYDRILEAANTFRNTQVGELPPIERFQILSIRHRIPLEERKKLDGRALLNRMVSERWFVDDDDDGEALRFGTIKVNGEYARANVIWEGKRTGFWFEFIKENGSGQPDPTATWKLDDPSRDHFWNDLVARLARKVNMSEDDMMVTVEELDSGRPVRGNIWDIP